MILSRRRALFGLFAAPAIIKTAGLLMPVRPVLAAPTLEQIRAAKVLFESATPVSGAYVHVEYLDAAGQLMRLAKQVPYAFDTTVEIGRLPAGSRIVSYGSTVLQVGGVSTLTFPPTITPADSIEVDWKGTKP